MADRRLTLKTKIDIDYIEAEKKIKKLQKELDALEAKKAETQNKITEAEADEPGIEANIRKAEADMKAAKAAGNTAAYKANKEDFAELSAWHERNSKNIEKLNDDLEKTETKISDINKEIVKTKQTEIVPKHTRKEITSSGDALEKFGKRIAGLAKRVFIFSVITAGFRAIKKLADKILKTNDEARQALNELKGALLTIIQPLTEAVIPALTWIIKGLTRLIVTAAAWVAKMFGTDLAAAAKNAEILNDELAEASETAASFDELNVVGDDTENDPTFNFADKIDEMMLKEGDIEDFFCRLAEGIVKVSVKIIEFITDPEFISGMVNFGIELGLGLIDGLIKALPELIKELPTIIRNITDVIIDNLPTLIDAIVELFLALAEAAILLYPLDEILILKINLHFIENADTIFANVKKRFEGFLSSLLEGVYGWWEELKPYFSGAVNWLANLFVTVWNKIKSFFIKGGAIFDGIVDGIKAAFKVFLNALITGINRVISSSIGALNDAITKIRSINILGVTPFGWLKTIKIPQIPALAQGTVVPPNNRFLAMLGDNTKETEIVSPLSTMRQAVAEAMAEGNGRTEALLEELIDVVSRKKLSVTPSAALGSVVAKSERLYRTVTG